MLLPFLGWVTFRGQVGLSMEPPQGTRRGKCRTFSKNCLWVQGGGDTVLNACGLTYPEVAVLSTGLSSKSSDWHSKSTRVCPLSLMLAGPQGLLKALPCGDRCRPQLKQVLRVGGHWTLVLNQHRFSVFWDAMEQLQMYGWISWKISYTPLHLTLYKTWRCWRCRFLQACWSLGSHLWNRVSISELTGLWRAVMGMPWLPHLRSLLPVSVLVQSHVCLGETLQWRKVWDLIGNPRQDNFYSNGTELVMYLRVWIIWKQWVRRQKNSTGRLGSTGLVGKRPHKIFLFAFKERISINVERYSSPDVLKQLVMY